MFFILDCVYNRIGVCTKYIFKRNARKKYIKPKALARKDCALHLIDKSVISCLVLGLL